MWDPRENTRPPRPTSSLAAALSVYPRLCCISIPLLRHARKLNSPLLPVKFSLGLNRHCVIYCNLAINSVIPPCSSDWCAQQVFCVLRHIVTPSYISICLLHNDKSTEYNGGLFAWLWWESKKKIFRTERREEKMTEWRQSHTASSKGHTDNVLM